MASLSKLSLFIKIHNSYYLDLAVEQDWYIKIWDNVFTSDIESSIIMKQDSVPLPGPRHVQWSIEAPTRSSVSSPVAPAGPALSVPKPAPGTLEPDNNNNFQDNLVHIK